MSILPVQVPPVGVLHVQRTRLALPNALLHLLLVSRSPSQSDVQDWVHDPGPRCPPRWFSGGPQVFRPRPQFHGCEGVDGKLGGAPGAAPEPGWARHQERESSEDASAIPLSIWPQKWPGNTPDPRACFRAHFRAYSRASSTRESRCPQSIAGTIFCAAQPVPVAWLRRPWRAPPAFGFEASWTSRRP